LIPVLDLAAGSLGQLGVAQSDGANPHDVEDITFDQYSFVESDNVQAARFLVIITMLLHLFR
jgi:hypothetical protein